MKQDPRTIDRVSAPVIELRSVTLSFGSSKALDDVWLSFDPGEIHAIVGENGAGKSTCMNVAYGLLTPSSGELYIKGKQLIGGKLSKAFSPLSAKKLGIGMVHQHFMLAHDHTALDHIALELSEIDHAAWTTAGIIKSKLVEAKAEKLASELGFKIPWHAKVSDLSVGKQQQLEILKVLVNDADVLIFDEPTAVLAPQEIDDFLGLLKRLKAQSKTVILITHKLKEVEAVADRISILRKGKFLETILSGTHSLQQLADLMVGRQVKLAGVRDEHDKSQTFAGDLSSKALHSKSLLTIKDLTLKTKDQIRIRDMSFEIYPGEICGFAGLAGNGKSELFSFLCHPSKSLGEVESFSGEASYKNSNLFEQSNFSLRRNGLNLVPADRHAEAVMLDEDLRQNLLLGQENSFATFGFLNMQSINKKLLSLVEEFDVRTGVTQNQAKSAADLLANAKLKSLSGGNQQKFVMARELSQMPEIFLCAEPTRGVDVGSIEQIYLHLLAARRRGCGVLLFSSQLEELMELSDRILVLREQTIVATFKRHAFDEVAIGRSMLGIA